MACFEGWTSCNGFSLLVLLLLGVIINVIPLLVNRIDEGKFFQNPISCYEWWFPGIIGGGLLIIPATAASLAARKRACCNNRGGMLLSSLLNLFTILGSVYCMLVSEQALVNGPLICHSPDNSTASCEFSPEKLWTYPESVDLQWFTKGPCIFSNNSNSSAAGNWTSNLSPSGAKAERYKMIHFSVFVSLQLVGGLELLFGFSQILVGLLGCLLGVSKRQGRIV